MYVVAFDNDPRWLDLARAVLGASGHRIDGFAEPQGLLRAVVHGAPGAVLLNLDLPGDALDRVARALVGQPDQPLVVGATRRPPTEPGVAAARGRLPALRLLRHPVSMLELADLLAEQQRKRPAAPPPAAGGFPAFPEPPPAFAAPAEPPRAPGRPTRPVASGSLAALTDLLAPGAGGVSSPHRSALQRANESIMPRASAGLDPANVDLVLQVWRRHRTAELRLRGAPQLRPVLLRRGGFVDPRDRDALARMLRHGDLFAADLPGDDGPADRAGVATLLFEALTDPSATSFVHRHRADRLSVVDPDALGALRLPGGLRAMLSAPVEALGPACARTGVPNDELSVPLAALARMGVVKAEAPPPPPPAPRGEEPISTISGLGSWSSISSASTLQGLGRRSLSSTVTALGGRPVSGARPSGDMGGAAQVHARLERELSRLEGAAPAVVLGLPPGSAHALVVEVADRQRRRYAELAESPTLPAGARALAGRLVALIDDAERRFGWGGSELVSDAGGPEKLLLRARALIERADFAQADKVLSLAQRRSTADPNVLSPLGWARANNPSKPADQRMNEGLEMLLLAEQLDGESLDTARWLCKLMILTENPKGALLRARRGLKRAPDDAELRAVAHELERKLKAEGG
ncbi:MAG: hypothetical protein RL071_3661 [Pseudomonadota bacterium]